MRDITTGGRALGPATRTAHTAVRIVGAVTVLLVLHSVAYLAFAWPYPKFIRSDGELRQVLVERGSPWMITYSIGMASRDAVAGPVAAIIVPPDIHELRYLEVAPGSLDPYQLTMLQQMCGMGVESRVYDPVLSSEELRALTANHELKEYAESVYAVLGDETDETVVLFTDASHDSVYCIPASIAPRGTQQ